MTKVHETKVNRARVHGTTNKKTQPATWIFLLIIIIAAGAYFLFMQPHEQLTEDPVLVTINGEAILTSELDRQWNALPVQAKLQLEREQLLEQLIQERLLIQKADAEGITITDEQLNEFLNIQLAQTGTTEGQFAALLEQQGTSIDDIKNIYRRQLTIASLFEQAVGEEPIATQEDILAYYQENREQFYRDERVTVRHILVEAQNDTEPELVGEIEASLAENNNENFCELVNEYTMDLASRANCGEYTFARGVMVPAFETASFAMEVGELQTVESEFGYHIILKDAELPSGYAGLNSTLEEYPGQPTVQLLIEQTVIQNKARSVFDTYVQELEAEANIEYAAQN